MKILHVANFSLFAPMRKRIDDVARSYATDRKISNGLIRNGHCVLEFSYQDVARYLSPLPFGARKKHGAANMRAYLRNVAKQFQPDLILMGHCESLTAETLVALRTDLPGCKLAQWRVDWFVAKSLSHLCEKQPLLDAFFATSSPAHYAPLIRTDDSPPLYFMPNIIDSSVETGQSYAAASHGYDVFFAGASTPERADVLSAVAALDGIRCGFFGGDNAPFLGGASLMKAITNSKMGLNLSRTEQVPLYSSARLAQIVGNGCLALVPRVPEMENLFSEEEVAYCESEEELPDVVARYIKDDSTRRRKAEAGWRRGHGSYNERRIAKFIVEAAQGEKFSEEYEWLYATA